MPDRFWVGGTNSWNATAGTKWSATSGGPGGASVPTVADDVFFNAASGAATVTVANGVSCRSLNFTGFTGTFTGNFDVNAQGSVFISATTTWSHTGTLFFSGGGSNTLTSSGKSITGGIEIISLTTLSLSDALITGSINLLSGTFTTNNFNVTATSLSSSNSNTRTINLGSSTVTLSSGSTPINFDNSTNLAFNAGTSNIVLSGAGGTLSGGGRTFHNVSFTPTTSTAHAVNGANTYNNLSFAGRTTAGITSIILNASSTINGTLTLSAGTNATARTFVRSNIIGQTRTLTCAAVASLTDIDFRDITIAGAAAPVSGTRLGDCKGNSGITFPAPKTVYPTGSFSSGNWGSGIWSTTQGGVQTTTDFPLAQDTVVVTSTVPTTGGTLTLNAAYNIGTIDMSARTSNTMTLATGTQTPAIYGDWINGTGTTLTGTGIIGFVGRGNQTVTCAGRTFTADIYIETPGGSVTLQDAFTSSGPGFNVFAGTLDANGYNVTLTTGGVTSTNTSRLRTIAIGAGTWVLGFGWSVAATNLTVTGTGTISLTRATAKTFAGGGIQTYPTINQGGAGTLTISGSNKFANITDTVIGRVQFTGGSTNTFDAFNLSGVSGNLLQLGSTNTTQAILRKPGNWNVGANSTNGGNNTGLSFVAGGNDFLNISYINGVVVASASQVFYGNINVTNLRFGGSPVSAIFYGSTKIF